MRLASWLFAAAFYVGPVSALPAQATNATDARAQAPVGRGPAPLQRLVTLDLRDVPLLEAVQAIDRQAGLALGYTDRLLADRRVTIAVVGVPAEVALRRVLEGTEIALRASARGRLTLVRAAERAEAVPDTAFGAILGLVTDSSTGRPIADVRATVKGAGLSARTNAEGYYFLPRVAEGLHVVQLRMVGYRPVDLTLAVVEGEQSRADARLSLGMTRLQEVVTTASGARRRVELGNDITLLDADSITNTMVVRSVTDLMATRVPDLTAMRTSGAPGDPSRIRIRGNHSVHQGDDPIVIVDGVRIYSQQSAKRSANLSSRSDARPSAAPSPIDQVDPNSIETLEVLKGPSAATLYGADAANGVIVITTKRGRIGPPRWTLSTSVGQTEQTGSYPLNYYRWGHGLTDDQPRFCPLRDQACVLDSVVRVQLLNDPRFTILGRGERRSTSLGVSGGSAGLSYSFTGSYGDELGSTRMPRYELARYRSEHGVAVPDWASRPHRYGSWSGSASLQAQASPKLSIGLTSSLTRGDQGRSSLDGGIAALMNLYVDTTSGRYWVSDGGQLHEHDGGLAFNGFYRRVTAVTTSFLNGVNVHWTPRTWLTAGADAGLQLMDRDDRALTLRGMAAGADSVGVLRLGRGRSLMKSFSARATATAPEFHALRTSVSVGANYAGTTIADVQTGGRGLAPGSSSLNDAEEIEAPVENRTSSATAGFYIEPSLAYRGLYISTALRFDGGSTFGSRASMPRFPKLGLSYLVSEAPFFPEQPIVSSLRVRAAYGQAGVQPGIGDRLRLYTRDHLWNGRDFADGSTVLTLGNARLRPERSREWEGGLDVGLLDDRLSLTLSGYRNTRYDALLNVPLPPSVYGEGASVWRNIGVVRNTGGSASLSAQLLRTDPVTLGLSANVSRNRNLVVSLAPGMQPINGVTGVRVVAGYPLYGRWARPIVGYQDLNGNGLITADEVQVGDSMVYMGATMPNYHATFSPSASLFRGALSVNASFEYEDGLTQLNMAALNNRVSSRAFNDPNAPLGEQAAVAVMHRTYYGLIQTVSTFRFNGLSVAYRVPTRLAQRAGTDALSVALQGDNLGLHTNYRGKDPNVNAYTSGNDVADTGVLPMPRTWQVRVSASF